MYDWRSTDTQRSIHVQIWGVMARQYCGTTQGCMALSDIVMHVDSVAGLTDVNIYGVVGVWSILFWMV